MTAIIHDNVREVAARGGRPASRLEQLVLQDHKFVDPFGDDRLNYALWKNLIYDTLRCFPMAREKEPFAGYALSLLTSPLPTLAIFFGRTFDKTGREPQIGDLVISLESDSSIIRDLGSIGRVGVYIGKRKGKPPSRDSFNFYPEESFVLEINGQQVEFNTDYITLAGVWDIGSTIAKPKPLELNEETQELYEEIDEQLRTGRKPGRSLLEKTVSVHRRDNASQRAGLDGINQEGDAKKMTMIVHNFLDKNGLYDYLASTRRFLADYGRAGEQRLQLQYPEFYANFLKFCEVARHVAGIR